MLKEINIKSLSAKENNSFHKDICYRWYEQYSRMINCTVNPSRSDYHAAMKLVEQIPSLQGKDKEDLLSLAINNHFQHWRQAWYLTMDSTRNCSVQNKKPEWNFKNFCMHFSEILMLGEINETSKARSNIVHPKMKKCVSEEIRDSILRRVLENEKLEDNLLRDYIIKFEKYYGQWQSDEVLESVVDAIKNLDENEFESFYRTMIEIRPVKWGAPDLNSVISIKEKKKWRYIENGRSNHRDVCCPVCNTKMSGNSCRSCQFEIGDNLTEYRDWYEKFKSGKMQDVGFDMSQITNNTRKNSSKE